MANLQKPQEIALDRISSAKRNGAKFLDLDNLELVQLPDGVTELTALKHLSVNNNCLVSVPPEIGNLTDLKNLSLSGNQLTSLPAEIGNLTALRSLSLSANQLASLPKEIGDLTALQQLFLHTNQLTSVPSELGRLSGLQQLLLRGNQLNNIPAEIGKLTALRLLLLNGNRLTSLPMEIGGLTALQHLSLSGNLLTSLPEEIGDLIALQYLSLSGNLLTNLPAKIGGLTALRDLLLSGNLLASLPMEIGSLTALQQLLLRGNQLTNVPAEIGRLTSLRRLSLSGNRLTSVPAEIGKLSALRQLSLSDNQLTSLPMEIGKLTALERLSLRGNQLASVPAEIGCLAALQQLLLRCNQLTSVPVHIGALPMLRVLDITGNPALRLPPHEIAELGSSASIRYLKALHRGEAPIWESRMLLVGEGGVGKTWLHEALEGRLHGGNRSTDGATIGIEIGPLNLPNEDSPDGRMTLNCWDFSGQAVNHATHQFFFSDHILFMLVWNMRQGWEAGRLRHWLTNIRDRAPRATIILVGTHSDQPHADYPEKTLLAEFSQISKAFAVSSQTGDGLVLLKEEIARQAVALPMMGLRWPSTWWDGFATVKALAATVTHADISVVYREMCGHGLEAEDAVILLRWMHELGEVLHFADDQELAELAILNPEWAAKKIGVLLASHEVAQAKGILTSELLRTLWPDINNATRDHLISLTERFDLAYRIPDDPNHRCMVVEKLPQNPAEYEARWAKFASAPELRLRFKLAAMHPGIPTWFIARQHRFTLDPWMHWLRGVLFGDERSLPRHLGLVIANETERVVDFTVRGPFPPTFMTLLTEAFIDTVRRRYEGLDMERLVPCPGPPGQHPCGHYFKLSNLEKRLVAPSRRTKIDCEECGFEHEVAKLLFGLSLAPESEELTAKVIREIVHEEVAQDGECTRNHIDARLAETLAYIHLQFVREWNTQQLLEEQSCPTVFSLYAVDNATLFHSEKLRLQFYCMQPGCWHPIGAEGACQFAQPKEWLQGVLGFLRSYGPLVKTIVSIAKPAAGVLLKLTETSKEKVETWKEGLENTAKLLEALEDAPDSSEFAASPSARIQPRHHSDASLHDLKKFLDSLEFPKRPYGGLERVRTPENHILWLCPEHGEQYRRGI